MEWEKPKGFSRKHVDRAGAVLISKASDKEKEESLKVLNNHREIHKYPLHIFRKRLKSSAEEIDKLAFSVGRLKRFSSIIRKLKRNPSMKLSRMQDIAGCRAVMANHNLAKKLYEEKFLKGKLKHKKIKVDDYIMYPKEDGYRSYHLVYRYLSEKKGKQDFNGLLVEVQIRSKLQHLWATAIEVADFFTGQGLKFNKGLKDWKEFFRLVSSAFAIEEKTSLVQNTPTNKRELYNKINKIERELKLFENMNKWTDILRIFGEQTTPKDKYFLLEIDVKQERLTITAFTKEKEDKAIDILERLEKQNMNRKEYDVVLVGADRFEDLRKAYPNYFADTREFLGKLKGIFALS
jgi:ppGpp synthetase/RelA/SpoT-type nucleotidyltranferase